MSTVRLGMAALLLMLAACGQKGSLYFAEPTSDTPAAAASTDDKDNDKDAPAPQDP